ncbi:hypothetical protein [Deinococcus yavapaiensis]|uniref:Uncharacterized protein n=1 Tax=Deinococcus yavapaiensis KR-236 TaxID=694435 RepID=A0A318S1X1_9DEIO|nr:hypothetical protein [Deinococcus yavapaiensis]PYE51817.1 hypothetical protein DES52_11417 [Deinococcus yavapaiensis KR-236]
MQKQRILTIGEVVDGTPEGWEMSVEGVRDPVPSITVDRARNEVLYGGYTVGELISIARANKRLVK